jgi:hypothetical protein
MIEITRQSNVNVNGPSTSNNSGNEEVQERLVVVTMIFNHVFSCVFFLTGFYSTCLSFDSQGESHYYSSSRGTSVLCGDPDLSAA